MWYNSVSVCVFIEYLSKRECCKMGFFKGEEEILKVFFCDINFC